MAIKLIAIVMDGTLLNPQHEIIAAVKLAISRARDKGAHCVGDPSSVRGCRALSDGT